VSSRTAPKTPAKRRPGRAAPARAAPSSGQWTAALRRIPVTGWVCALIACLNAVCWSVISPPFQVVDESAHYAYVQRLAETGRLPSSGSENYPPAEERALYDLHNAAVLEHPSVDTISTEAEQRKLEHDLAVPEKRTGSGGAGVAASQPPLYYALETIPYALESGGTVLDRLVLMRLLSALMGGLTALFAYLFLREALPAAPWAWTVGGLGVALEPLLGVMSGSVNPDALLFAVSAALFYCLARGFRRGLTPKLAVALGAVCAVGFLTKLTFLGLLPGAVLGVVALCVREARTGRNGDARNAYHCLGLALAAGAGPSLLYVAVDLLSHRPAVGVLGNAVTLNHKSGSIFKELSYIWQFYLPRLPGMTPDFHGFLPTRVYWFRGLVGIYGWLDAAFPRWVYNFALIPTGLIVVLFARALVVGRRALGGRFIEASVYAAMTLGVLFIVGSDDYINKAPGEFAEPRYLLPMLALWGLVLALAARGAGRRWGPVAGVLIVTAVMAQNVFGQLLDISRYYG
jgi:4-amino-4-deoxy-L-arabinose transferase-like glycosyltransferase